MNGIEKGIKEERKEARMEVGVAEEEEEEIVAEDEVEGG